LIRATSTPSVKPGAKFSANTFPLASLSPLTSNTRMFERPPWVRPVGPQKVHYFSDRRAPVTVRILRNGKVAVATSAEITEARFQLDEPSGVVNQLTHVTVNEVPATMFFGSNSVMGDTREIWFIRGFFYEVTTYKEFDSWLTPIMQTWQFTP
jgi:hypothetical protein